MKPNTTFATRFEKTFFKTLVKQAATGKTRKKKFLEKSLKKTCILKNMYIFAALFKTKVCSYSMFCPYKIRVVYKIKVL